MDAARIDFTEQERAIVALLAQGETVRRIAEATELPPNSVAKEIETCRHKLQARNNVELVAKALRSGIFSD